MSADDLLEYFGVRGHPRVFVLGCLEQRVTIHDQQVRAANLIWAIHKTKVVRAGQRLGIVGSGFAGVTAAVAAQRVGFVPILYEKLPAACHLQHNSPRWVHPRIYDWPEKGWDGEHLLPFMRWDPAPVSQVAQKIREDLKGITTHYKTRITKIEPENSRVFLTPQSVIPRKFSTIPQSTPSRSEFAAVVLALGFGTESSKPKYWNPDDGIESDDDSDYWYIGGLGDGALIDFARLRLTPGPEDEGNFYGLLQRIAKSTPAPAIRQILYLERHAKNLSRTPEDSKDKVGAALHDGLRRIIENWKQELGETEDIIKSALRGDILGVRLVGRHASPYSLSASMLNRWILALLLRWDEGAGYIHGFLTEDYIELPGSPDTKFPHHPNRTIIRRYGSNRPLPTEPWLKKIYDAIPTPHHQRNLDGARKPQWGDYSWQPPSPPDVTPPIEHPCIFTLPRSAVADLLELHIQSFPPDGRHGILVILYPAPRPFPGSSDREHAVPTTASAAAAVFATIRDSSDSDRDTSLLPDPSEMRYFRAVLPLAPTTEVSSSPTTFIVEHIIHLLDIQELQ